MARWRRRRLISNRHIIFHDARLLHTKVLAHDDVDLVSDVRVLYLDAPKEAEGSEKDRKGSAEIPLPGIEKANQCR